MWHIFPLWLVRHVVMGLLIAGLKDKPLFFASDVVNDLSTSVFLFPEREREGKTGKESTFPFLLLHFVLWYLLIYEEWVITDWDEHLWCKNYGQFSYSTLILPPLLQDDPIFKSSSVPHMKLISQTLCWCQRYLQHICRNLWVRNHMIKPQKVWLTICFYSRFPKSA